MDVRDCHWDTRDDTKYRFPIGSDDKHATLLAVRYRQWDVDDNLTRRVPSLDRIEPTTGEDGTPRCFKRKAVKVQSGSHVVWCVRLFRFKRRGRVRKYVGTGLIVVGGAAAIAATGGAALHLFGITPLIQMIGGAGGPLISATGLLSQGARGEPTKLVMVGDPVTIAEKDGARVTCVAYKQFIGSSPAKLVYEDGQTQECRATTEGGHERCG
jgi:hypothetical protein